MARGRRKSESPATARRILAAAEQHFAAEGMAGARTDEIAAAARANKAMLYYYFGNKRRLHRAVLENLFRQLLRDSNVPPKEGQSPHERLRAFVAGYFDFLSTHPNYPRLLQREAMEGSRNFGWIVREYLRPFHQRLVRTIQEGIAAGEFRAIDPDHTALSILGMTTSYFAAAPILSEIVGHDLLMPRAVEARKCALFDFLDHGLNSKQARTR
ncbi:MAG TPA: CerR family C-terminal domain-containing protein [Candidatus Acidoferrales bacterium]|nr:CerR family C-terminal domain-containing protein [Candidatus Acidoferrales bacterium]